jgi:methyl-accepting chemotaxis protein
MTSPLPDRMFVQDASGTSADNPPGQTLRRWAAFGAVQRRVADSLVDEVRHTSQDICAETSVLSSLFQDLALKADAQNTRVTDMSSAATRAEIDGREVPLAEVVASFEETLSGIVQKILSLSQNAMSMVYAFDEVSTSMAEVERCIMAVDKINGQTRMLAVNARIEAARAGEAGRTFTVISDEVRTLSTTTQQLAETMRKHVTAVRKGLQDSHEALRGVATVDLSDSILAKDKLDSLVGMFVRRSVTLGAIAQDASADAQEISRQVNMAITTLQFQDRVSQRLEQVVDTLQVTGDAMAKLQEDTADTLAVTAEDTALEIAWLHDLASRYRLSEMRAAFVSRVIEGREAVQPAADAASAVGSIELF